MDIDQYLAVVERWYKELWGKPDLNVADEIIAEDYAPDWIYIEKKGPDQVKHEINYFRSVFPDLRYEIIDAVVAGNKVWVRYKGIGTQQGAAWGFESTNKEVSFEGITIFWVNERGKITNRWGAFSFYDIFG